MFIRAFLTIINLVGRIQSFCSRGRIHSGTNPSAAEKKVKKFQTKTKRKFSCSSAPEPPRFWKPGAGANKWQIPSTASNPMEVGETLVHASQRVLHSVT